MLMKRLFIVLSIVLAGFTCVSCSGLLDGILDMVGDVLEDMEDMEDGEGPDEDEGGPEGDQNITQTGIREAFGKFDGYVKSIFVYPRIDDNEYASEMLNYLTLYRAEFSYDEYGRPLSLTRKAYSAYLGDLDIETYYEFTYLDDDSAQYIERRVDKPFDDGSDTDYEYPPVTYRLKPYLLMTKFSRDDVRYEFENNQDGWLTYVNEIRGSERYPRTLRYDDYGYLYVPSCDQLWGADMPSNVNIDYNMLLLHTDFMDLNFGLSLPMIMRMGGSVGPGLMSRYFVASGTNGGGYYGYFGKENAGKTLHFEDGRYLTYNEDRTGAEVYYRYDDLGNVDRMRIELPVAFYSHEYDVVVSTEPLPDDPGIYPMERIENEVNEKLTEAIAFYTYEFEYYSAEEVLGR